MIKTIRIDDRSVEINTSAGWLYEYRENFGHDILPDIMPILESVLNATASVLNESGGKFNEKEILKAMNNDFLVDAFIKMAGMEMTTLYNIFWALAKNADNSIEQPKAYFNGFDVFPMDEILPMMFSSIVDSSISSKNAKSLLEKIRKMREEQDEEENQSTSTPSQSPELTGGSQ